MPHYHFDIKDRLVDPSGLNFKDDDDALAKAKVSAIGGSLDKPAVDPERHIAVLNNSRGEFFGVTAYSKPLMSMALAMASAVTQAATRCGLSSSPIWQFHLR
jgi:hypothetical protein